MFSYHHYHPSPEFIIRALPLSKPLITSTLFLFSVSVSIFYGQELEVTDPVRVGAHTDQAIFFNVLMIRLNI